MKGITSTTFGEDVILGQTTSFLLTGKTYQKTRLRGQKCVTPPGAKMKLTVKGLLFPQKLMGYMQR